MLRFRNTLSGKVEEFHPMNEGEVRFYYCGPTVWEYGHIGNFRSAVAADIVRRYLKFKGYKVLHVMNITDVEDRIIAKSQQAGLSIDDYTAKYIDALWEDFDALGCERPEIVPRATRHIPEMVSLIEKLLETNHAYASDGSIYYRIASFPDYGKLSKINFAGNIAGASERIDTDKYEKEDARDFALWKEPANENEPAWDAPIGRGRPGWHIECSAMAWKHLGEQFDIHGGGIDLVFPHHENELAQSACAFHADRMANVWMHNGFLQVEGDKMSKSEGNFVTIRELLADWPGEVLRLSMLKTHYRSPIDWTLKAMEESAKTLDDWYWVAADAKGETPSDAVIEALSDDLNTPQMITSLHSLRNRAASGAEQDRKEFAASLRLLGFLSESAAEWKSRKQQASGVDPKQIDGLISDRTAARARKDFKESDRIRDELAAMGVVIKDSKDGTTWEIAR
ncbi:MAG TPA: cysteine--tRNA ligase [Blastocatellia bacterium]|nr:cysteine--tRNA ligase [Blastocatellia bacterium]